MRIESIAFSPNPKMSTLNGKELYLADQLSIYIVADGKHHKWVVPKGFITDLRSGPDIARLVLPKWGNNSCHCALILLHDYLYCAKPDLPRKSDADDFLVEGLRWAGHPGWKCSIVRAALKLAGGSRFGKDKIRVWDETKQEVREL